MKGGRAVACICVLLALFVIPLLGFAAEGPQEKKAWQGVDEAVVGRVAREHGREPVSSLLFRGDLPVLMFLLAGAAGGFIAGYYWRKLLEGRKQ